MACCILIMLWVANELSYDKFNQYKDRIYRLCVDFEAGSHIVYPMTMSSAAPLLIQEFPEVVNAARLEYPRRGSVKYKTKYFKKPVYVMVIILCLKYFHFLFWQVIPNQH